MYSCSDLTEPTKKKVMKSVLTLLSEFIIVKPNAMYPIALKECF